MPKNGKAIAFFPLNAIGLRPISDFLYSANNRSINQGNFFFHFAMLCLRFFYCYFSASQYIEVLYWTKFGGVGGVWATERRMCFFLVSIIFARIKWNNFSSFWRTMLLNSLICCSICFSKSMENICIIFLDRLFYSICRLQTIYSYVAVCQTIIYY
ncbi:hypothetical protein ABFS82_11G080700 [Erythranthe guttata]